MPDARSFRYRVVDVFTEHPLEGNALAVFPDASGLDDATMQKIARELNLSETTFVLPATQLDCAARVRIFTPAREMLFAGHPTIGTSFVLLDEGRIPAGIRQFRLEEEVGPVPIRVDPGPNPLIWLRTPRITEGRTFDHAMCAKALGLKIIHLLPISPQLLSAGNPTVFVALKNRAAVDRAWLDSHGSSLLKAGQAEMFCVFVFAPTPGGAYSRMFAPDYGVAEDPATGSSTGPLAAFMLKHGLLSGAARSRFISEQGAKMNRRSLLHVQPFGENGRDAIDVGGHVTAVAEAAMSL